MGTLQLSHIPLFNIGCHGSPLAVHQAHVEVTSEFLEGHGTFWSRAWRLKTLGWSSEQLVLLR